MNKEKMFYEAEYDRWIDSQFTKTLRYGKRFATILFTKSPQRIRKGGVSRFES